MLSRLFPSIFGAASSCSSSKKVAVLGASGGIGQPLSLLLKFHPSIASLSLYDIAKAASPCKGVAADISHINHPAKVSGFSGDEELPEALRGADVVVLTAGVPRKPGMTRDDLFTINAGIVKNLAENAAKNCPDAILLIISNPVNSTVPVASEVYKKAACYDWRKLIGVTTLDCIRANTFVAEKTGKSPTEISVPVVGGHAGPSIMPVLSQVTPAVSFSPEDIMALDKRIQDAGTEVVEAKQGSGSATLSMAYAAAQFTDNVLRGLEGDSNVACGYVGNQSEVGYFSWPLELGKNGVEKVIPLTQFSEYEQQRLEVVKAQLLTEIRKGEDFVLNDGSA